MATGLLALLDDIAGIAKMAAASLDDVAVHAGKAGAKAAGVVVDDAAVTPRYVTGFTAARELPMVRRIAIGSLRNKLVFLLPIALALSALAPWAITPLLLLGGLFLCYEGAEKLYEAIAPHAAHAHEAHVGAAPADPAALEAAKVAGAIRTDFILSAEIMAITLSGVSDAGLAMQAIVLALVGTAITVVVYGAVALIVKADDAGVILARSGNGALQGLGRALVAGMPGFLKALAAVGTAAMLWVGGGIVIHGLEAFGLHAPGRALHAIEAAAAGTLPALAGAAAWLAGAAASFLLAILVGALLIPTVERLLAPAWRGLRRAFGRGG